MAAPGKKVLLSVGVVAAVLCVALLGVLFGLRQYVQSDAFRSKVETNLSDSLRAVASLNPLEYSAGTLRSSAFSAHGLGPSWFSKLELEPIRAELSFSRVFQGVFQIDRIEAERATLDLSGPRLAFAFPPMGVSKGPDIFISNEPRSRTAQRVEVQALKVQNANVTWTDGRLRDVAIDGTRDGSDWAIRGINGTLTYGDWPPLIVDSFRLRQHGERLTVERAELHQGATGTVVVDGEVRFKDALELNAKIDRIAVEPLLAADWKKRLTGNLNGTVQIKSPLPAVGMPELSGSLTLTEGKLEALPVLNELATFTQLAQFRTLTLSRVQGDFRQRDGRLSVNKLAAESSGLMRIEGAFVIENEQIKGDFQVGLAPNTLQWLPGARTKLFAATRDGYCWAPMHLEGPVDSPREDLSPRLIAAVTEGAIEGTVESLRKAGESLPGQVPEAAKKLLDMFLGK
jgi:hypothetical protein